MRPPGAPVAGGVPDFDEVVRDVAAFADDVVGPTWIDVNGHMNIEFHFMTAATAVGLRYERAGLGHRYRAERRMSLFTRSHQIHYHSEIRVGARVTAHPLLMDRSDKALHAVAFLADHAQQVVATVMEIVLVHVGLDSRQAIPFPADVAEALDREIAGARRLTWAGTARSDLWRVPRGPERARPI